MSHRLPVIAAVAFVLSVPLASLATRDAGAQTSYPLICKGGGNMIAQVRATAQVRVQFAAGADAASNAPPSPGQCSWLDRGFRSGEPAVLTVAGDPAHALYIVESVMRGDTFYAHVYNDGKGSMVITRVGP